MCVVLINTHKYDCVLSLSSVAGADYGPIDMVLEVSSVDTLLITVSINLNTDCLMVAVSIAVQQLTSAHKCVHDAHTNTQTLRAKLQRNSPLSTHYYSTTLYVFLSIDQHQC